MKRRTIPEPKLISLSSTNPPAKGAKNRSSIPPELRQQRVDEFLDARSLAPNSRKAYQNDLERFMRWTDTAWANVTQRQVTQFKSHLLRTEQGKRVLSDASARRILQTLKNFLGWMLKSGYIDRDPTQTISLPKVAEAQANNLTDAQVEAIKAAVMETSLPERNMALLSVLGHGLRASEAANLNIGDFEGERLQVRVAKSDSKGSGSAF